MTSLASAPATHALTPRASIVLLCYDHWDLTERCLVSIDEVLGTKLGREIELVVVDNGSTDETPTRLEAWRDRATIVSLMPNRQFSGGCNAGAAAARGDVLIFLNNDTEASPGVFEALVEQALDPTVGLVGLRLLYRDGTIQHGGVTWRKTGNGMCLPFHPFRHEAGDLPAASVELDLDAVTGACIAIRRELFAEVGGFDERYLSGYEDIDLCVRVRLRDLRVVYRGDLWLLHDEGLTRGRNNREQENIQLFQRLWAHMIDDDSELLARTFDASFSPWLLLRAQPGIEPWGTAVSVEGEVLTLAPNAAEARALLRGFDQAQLEPAARDWLPVWISPRFEDDELELLGVAIVRVKRADTLVVHVPAGLSSPVPHGAAHVLRAAVPPPKPLPHVAAVWVPSTGSVGSFVQAGFDPERIDVLPPIVAGVPVGPGGDGVVAIVPAEDLEVAAAILTGLAGFDGSVRLVPTVASPRLEALAQDLLPTAQLLGPIASEQRLGALLATSDAVVCGSTGDAFQRHALVAASGGAVPIVLVPGAASEYVHDIVQAGPDGADVAAAIARALACPSSREERSRAVAVACSPAAVEARLYELIVKAQELRGQFGTALAA